MHLPVLYVIAKLFHQYCFLPYLSILDRNNWFYKIIKIVKFDVNIFFPCDHPYCMYLWFGYIILHQIEEKI